MTRILDVTVLDDLVASLGRRGYLVVGPTVRDGAIVYDELHSADELPAGWTDVQDAGSYRLERRDDDARFGYAAGPASWKAWLLPPRVQLWRSRPDLEVEEEPLPDRPLALLGVRACELAAIGIQDRVLLGGRYADRDYAARRKGLFVVAVDCHEPGGTCFCASTGTGPRAAAGYDLALTELPGPRYLAEVGSPAGGEILQELGGEEPTEADLREAVAQGERAAARMGRRLESPEAVPELLRASFDSPRWDEVAERCLSCGNCTLACPTCFCTTVVDANDLTGAAERTRLWDSCFSIDYSYIHGGAIRQSPKARYRQWLTHKLSTWHDQFGSSGCVGCGRCITWCPVGIDITEEVAALSAAGKDTE